ncbi:MAG: UDP-forming cellulose synthase catalytic subunit, partial [Verrucomicrobiales bacterium]
MPSAPKISSPEVLVGDHRPQGGLIIKLLWFASFAGFLFLAYLPVGTDAQLYLGVSAGALVLLLRYATGNPTLRMFFLFTAAYLSLRYIFWRTFNTLEYYDPISYACAIILYVAELYGIAIYLLGIFVNISPIYRPILPLPEDESVLPTVDVFIPSYNEDINLLKITVSAALQMKYPEGKHKVYLLDDGGTDAKVNQDNETGAEEAKERRAKLQALCAELGAQYRTRAKNEHAKAGNINTAFHQTNGELIVIFDADHVPTQDFLQNTVGWFLRDPKLFLVQTPHFFTNPDPVEKNLETFDKMPSEQEMFYTVVQRGLDFWNSSFFCGSAAVMRRKCLEEVGGIVGDTITEDAETALTLHGRGYNSAYIGRPMCAGLATETLGGFIGQRIRWAQGMMQIFLLKNPLFYPGLSFSQRLCYLNSCGFWLFPFARIIFTLAPLGFLFFGLKIYASNWADFLAHAVPHLVCVLIVSTALFGRVRWSFVSELYEMMQAIFCLPAIIKVF